MANQIPANDFFWMDGLYCVCRAPELLFGSLCTDKRVDGSSSKRWRCGERFCCGFWLAICFDCVVSDGVCQEDNFSSEKVNIPRNYNPCIKVIENPRQLEQNDSILVTELSRQLDTSKMRQQDTSKTRQQDDSKTRPLYRDNTENTTENTQEIISRNSIVSSPKSNYGCVYFWGQASKSGHQLVFIHKKYSIN